MLEASTLAERRIALPKLARRIGEDLFRLLRAPGWLDDARSGLTVALAAWPLSLAIALASDAPVSAALTSAVVAGLVASALSGVPGATTAPAAALAILTGTIYDAHGPVGVAVAAAVAGLVQLTTGLGGFARFARLVPTSVLQGFDAGLAMLLLVGQLPRVLGLDAPDDSHVFDVVTHVGSYLHEVNVGAIAAGSFAIVLALSLSRVFPRVPIAAFALGVPAVVLAAAAPGAVPTFADLPSHAASRPSSGVDWASVLADAVVVAGVCSVESLRALQRQLGERVEIDLDRELVAQGAANVAVGLALGMPASIVPRRTRLALAAGATTQRAGLFAALALGVLAYVAQPLVRYVPIAAASGLVVVLAFRLLQVDELVRIAKHDRAEAAVLALTAGSMLLFDFEAGIQAGVVMALLVGLVRGSRSRMALEPGAEGVPHHVVITGPLTFIHLALLDRLELRLAPLAPQHGLVLDVRHVDQLDHSAAQRFAALVEHEKARGMRVAILGPRADVLRALTVRSPSLAEHVAHREKDLDRILERARDKHAQLRLVHGVSRFRDEVRGQLSPLLTELADGQEPHTLFITCADSRVAPELMTGSQPGDLFVVRNIGALVPPAAAEDRNDEGAAIEYAVRVLGVRNIVVCGHSRCGAMKALKTGEVPSDLHALRCWSTTARPLIADPTAHAELDALTRATSRLQVAHVESYPVVRDAMARGELTVTAWFYDVEQGEVLAWNDAEDAYQALVQRDAMSARRSLPPSA